MGWSERWWIGATQPKSAMRTGSPSLRTMICRAKMPSSMAGPTVVHSPCLATKRSKRVHSLEGAGIFICLRGWIDIGVCLSSEPCKKTFKIVWGLGLLAICPHTGQLQPEKAPAEGVMELAPTRIRCLVYAPFRRLDPIGMIRKPCFRSQRPYKFPTQGRLFSLKIQTRHPSNLTLLPPRFPFGLPLVSSLLFALHLHYPAQAELLRVSPGNVVGAARWALQPNLPRTTLPHKICPSHFQSSQTAPVATFAPSNLVAYVKLIAHSHSYNQSLFDFSLCK